MPALVRFQRLSIVFWFSIYHVQRVFVLQTDLLCNRQTYLIILTTYWEYRFNLDTAQVLIQLFISGKCKRTFGLTCTLWIYSQKEIVLATSIVQIMLPSAYCLVRIFKWLCRYQFQHVNM